MESGASGRRILANAAFRSVAEVGGKLASIALFVVLARKVGDAQFGVYSFGLAFAGLATTLGALGQDSILTREVARDRSRLEDYFGNTLALRLVLTVPVLAIAVGAATALGMGTEARTVALLLGLGLTAELLASVCFAVFQSFERLEYIAVVLLTQRWITAGAGIAALALGAGIVTVAAIYMAGCWLGALLGFVLVRRRIARPRLRIDVSRWPRLMRAALPVGISALSVTVLARIDMAILAIYEPDAVVGRYGAAYRIYESTLFVGWSVTAAFLPVLSRLTPSSEPPLGRMFEQGLKLVLALALPLTAGTVALAEPVIRLLFGPQFTGGAGAARILAPAMTLAAVSYLASHLLIAQDRQGTMAWIYAVIAIENVAANFVLIPLLSLDGAALDTALSEALVVVALLVVGTRLAGPFGWRRVLTGPLTAAAASAGVMLGLQDIPLVAAVAGGLAYLAVLYAVERVAFPDDAARLRALLAFRPRAAPRSGA